VIYGLWSLLTVFSATGVQGAGQDSADSGRMSYHMEDLTSALDTTLQENDEVTLFSQRHCVTDTWLLVGLAWHGMKCVRIHLFCSLRVRR